MADSNITKLALSNALKELLEEQSFEKISVSDICERCGMNRKSFYYHFKDKYDLVNWIFDTEFIVLMQEHKAKMGSLAGGSDDSFGRNMGKTTDAMLSRATKVLTIVFFVVIIALGAIMKFMA